MLSLKPETCLDVEGYDGVILVYSSIQELTGKFSCFAEPLIDQIALDKSVELCGACLAIGLPCKRAIFCPTGPINRDYDDVRRYYDAAHSGIERALKAGIRKPLFAVIPTPNFPHACLVGLLGALQKLYVPLEIREDIPDRVSKVEYIGVLGDSKMVHIANALERGRIVARDIGGSDPERMAPPKAEEYILQTFSKSSEVKVEVISDNNRLEKEYPLFSAVNRCAKGVPRHRGRIIYLIYEGKGPIEQTLMLVGKGVTYDTGGADIKAGGVMAGMHRDKCGSAAVAGFMQIIDVLKPPHLKVIGAMAMVRNSVGSDCYVADEIITSRAGVRVRVRNTDAEGRMAMTDVLCRMKELAFAEVNPYLMTIATLTGHCVLAFGEEYTAVMDNGPAYLKNMARLLQDAGDTIACPFEISTLRREDYKFNEAKCESEDVLQANCLPSSRTERGHQVPAAFMIVASGLDHHGKDSDKPLKYSHLDIAGSAGSWPCPATAAPILALAKAFISKEFEGCS